MGRKTNFKKLKRGELRLLQDNFSPTDLRRVAVPVQSLIEAANSFRLPRQKVTESEAKRCLANICKTAMKTQLRPCISAADMPQLSRVFLNTEPAPWFGVFSPKRQSIWPGLDTIDSPKQSKD